MEMHQADEVSRGVNFIWVCHCVTGGYFEPQAASNMFFPFFLRILDKEEDDKETLHFETDLVSYGRQSLAVSPLQTGPRLLSALRAPGGSRPSFIFEPKVMDVGSVALIRWYLHQRLSDEFISSSYLVLPRLTSHHFLSSL